MLNVMYWTKGSYSKRGEAYVAYLSAASLACSAKDTQSAGVDAAERMRATALRVNAL